MKQALILLTLFAFVISCKKDRGPAVPSQAVLEFPGNNSECTTGISTGPTTSEVEFRWQAANNAESYELQVQELETAVLQRAITVNTFFRVNLKKGTAYSWKVISRNSGVERTESQTWQFYNAGSVTSYPPFPASIQSPASGQTVAPNTNDQVLLEWTGADADGDLESFEVWVGGSENNLASVATRTASQNSFLLTVQSGQVYYWRILSRDSQGSSSQSGLYSFRVP